MTPRPIEQIKAGKAFRDTMIARADTWIGNTPLWFGWAIMDAFLAGIDYARIGVRAAALEDERKEIAEQARRYAGHYQEGSDGRNTFIMLAEWIEART